MQQLIRYDQGCAKLVKYVCQTFEKPNCPYISITFSVFFLLSLNNLMVEKYCFSVKFSKLRWIYMLWGPLNPKIIFIAVGMSVCACLLSTTLKNKLQHKHQIWYLYHTQMLLETFYKKLFKKRSDKNFLYRSIHKNSNTLRPI